MKKSKKIFLMVILMSFLSVFPIGNAYADGETQGSVDMYFSTDDGLIETYVMESINIFVGDTIPSGQYTVNDLIKKLPIDSSYKEGTTFTDILVGVSKVTNGTWTEADFEAQLGYPLTEDDLTLLADFIGYSVDEAQLQNNLNELMVFTTDGQINKFIVPFVKNDSKTTIHYQYDDGTKVADDYTVEGRKGISPNVKIKSPQIDGYLPDIENVEVTFNGLQEITVTYSELPLPIVDITIHFLDEQNPANELKGVIILPKEIGSIVDLTKENIDTFVDGYILQNQLDTSYEVKDGSNDIYLNYLKDTTKTDVTIHFVQGDNQTLSLKEPLVLKNQTVGATIDLSTLMIPKKIDRYSLMSDIDSTYTIKSGVNDIYLSYDISTVVPPLVESNPTAEQPAVTEKVKTKNSVNMKKLPQTSESTSTLLSVFGILIIFVGFIFSRYHKYN